MDAELKLNKILVQVQKLNKFEQAALLKKISSLLNVNEQPAKPVRLIEISAWVLRCGMMLTLINTSMRKGNGNIDLRHKNIFLDTGPLIYFIEGNSEHQEKLKQIFGSNDKGDLFFITSSIPCSKFL